jgi:hypothetical protein
MVSLKNSGYVWFFFFIYIIQEVIAKVNKKLSIEN